MSGVHQVLSPTWLD